MRAPASHPAPLSPVFRAVRPARAAAAAWWALCALAVLAPGGLWLHDRVRGWETPRWDEARFVPVLGVPRPAAAPASPAPRERWVVVVNPECPHCRESLARAAAARERLAPAPWLGALLVDTPVRPDSVATGALQLDGVWWDADGVWRGRWGHRVYGEVLRFARQGSYLGSFFPPEGSAPPDRQPFARTRARRES